MMHIFLLQYYYFESQKHSTSPRHYQKYSVKAVIIAYIIRVYLAVPVMWTLKIPTIILDPFTINSN